jgi:hypothetical protein
MERFRFSDDSTHMPIAELYETASAAREHLVVLETERATAALCGLDADQAYMADLRAEIDEFRAATIGLAVTEIASLRAVLDGPNFG